ncbi:hypothetical protein [Halobacterium litoreum]|uniref:Phasin domain-containing protein n=1 Tax=Halobacterium litoreum TaxID=2039234 RepID=A0ABD5NBA3_9EURY|nr:hypothetical protein [Halobacterium litoreum]UHH14544.1 hypothetical protein LT972_05975 [Halobacterium litoreum]
MSDAGMASPFAMQRRLLEQSHRATRQAFDVHRRFTRAFANSMDAQRSAQRETTTMANTALELPVVAMRATFPNEESLGDVEAAYEESLTSMADLTDEWWARTAQSTADALETYDGMVGVYADLVAAGFDTALAATDDLAAAGDWTDADWMGGGEWLDASGWPGEATEPVEIEVEGGGDGE